MLATLFEGKPVFGDLNHLVSERHAARDGHGFGENDEGAPRHE